MFSNETQKQAAKPFESFIEQYSNALTKLSYPKVDIKTKVSAAKRRLEGHHFRENIESPSDLLNVGSNMIKGLIEHAIENSPSNQLKKQIVKDRVDKHISDLIENSVKRNPLI